MALKTGLVRSLQSALGFVQPLLSTSTVVNFSHGCHNLRTLTSLSVISHNTSGFRPANHVLSPYQDKNTSSLSLISPINIIPVRHYQSVLKPRLHCKGCYFVWRHGRKHVECSDIPSHKQMKQLPTRKLWKEDYSKGNVRKAMIWNRDTARVSDRLCDKKVLSHNWLASRIGKDV